MPQKSFDRLQRLGEEQFTKVLNALMRGQPAQNLAREIQAQPPKGWGLFQDVAEISLTQQLIRFRRAAARGAFGPAAAKALEKGFAPKIQKLEGISLPTIIRLEELAARQRTRFLEAADKEAITKIAMSITNDVAKEYRQTLLDIQKIRFELGLDEYKGPVGQTSMRAASQTTSYPDGTSIQKQVFEAITTVEQIFNQRKIPQVTAK